MYVYAHIHQAQSRWRRRFLVIKNDKIHWLINTFVSVTTRLSIFVCLPYDDDDLKKQCGFFCARKSWMFEPIKNYCTFFIVIIIINIMTCTTCAIVQGNQRAGQIGHIYINEYKSFSQSVCLSVCQPHRPLERHLLDWNRPLAHLH